MKTIVEIEWDEPKEQAWLCADNIAIALHAYCVNTKFKVQAMTIAMMKIEQEPVAWMVYTQDGKSVYVTDNPTDIQAGQRALPLYTGIPK